MRIHDWDEVKASWSDVDTPEYRAKLQSARRELDLGMQVRELRLGAGLSQKQLARTVGSSQPAIARLEAGGGMPRIDTLDRVAQALGAELFIGIKPVRKPIDDSEAQLREVVPARQEGTMSSSAPASTRAKAKVPAKAAAAPSPSVRIAGRRPR